MEATEFADIAFTFDSKTLVTVSGDPDWVLYTFKCDKGKLDSSTKANNSNGTGAICKVTWLLQLKVLRKKRSVQFQIACNPNDANLLVVVGNQTIRILACTESIWRQYGYGKADQVNVTSAAWLSQDRLILGCNDGKILIIESGELKAVFWAGDMPIVNFNVKEE